MTQSLSCVHIGIFSTKNSKFCYIKKYRYNSMTAITLMMSAKATIASFLKVLKTLLK